MLLTYESVSGQEIVVIVSIRIIGLMCILNYDIRVLSKSLSFKGVERIFALMSWLSRMWFIELFSSHPMSKNLLHLGKSVEDKLDKGWAEVLGGQGAYSLFGSSRKNVRACQSFYFFYRMGVIFGALSILTAVISIVLL